MADPVTAALMQEAGPAARRGGNPLPIRFTDAEEAENSAHDRSPESRAELEKELGRKDVSPRARTILQAEFDRNFGSGAAPAPVPAPQQAANDPVTMALLGEAKAVSDKSVPDQAAPVAEQQKPSVLDRVKTAASAGPVGPLEAGASIATGLAGGLVGNVAGVAKGMFGGKVGSPEAAAEAARYAQEVAHSLTYQPRTEAGKEILGTLGSAMEASKLQGLGPAEGIALSGLAAGPKALSAMAPRAAAAEAPAARVPGQMGSVGAAGVAPAEQAKVLAATAKSPEIRQAIEKAANKITATGLRTAERHIEADTLPVPIRLTAGQATQDVTLLSQEQNAKGSKAAIANRFNEQNTQLAENVQAIREKTAPDVYATTKPELGETIIDAYKAKDKALNKTISDKYQALKDANGGAFPLDAKAFVASADAALHKGLLYDHLPPSIRGTLDRVVKDGMTFENFESLRTNLARLQRSQTVDGNVKAAAGTVRDALEALPLPTEAAHLKPLADAARAAAKERFALIDADPAYKAVTRGKASADKFIEKYVISADKKNLETMKANLAHDEVAQQTMGAGAMQRLRDAAGLTGEGGNFSQAGYNKALESMRPKLSVLLTPEARADAERLGNVARYVKGQPTGSFVNNSNTAVTLMGEAAKAGAAGVANVAAHGVPIGTWARKLGGYVSEQRDLNRSLQTGAGIRLKEVK